MSSCIALAVTGPAGATIDNAATANGSYDGRLVQSGAAIMELPVEPATARLEVSQSVLLDVTGGEDAENADGGDTLIVTLTVTNSGNVALRDVRPVNASIVSGSVAGTGSFADARPGTVAELAPGASRAFSVLYSMSDEDVYRAAGKENALAVKLAAAGAGPAGEVTVQADDATAAVAANPRISIAKAANVSKAEGNRGADLEAGDLVTYTYTVTNTGNVPIDEITIADEHEGVVLNSAEVASAEEGPFGETETTADPLGVSADESGANGVWDVLGAGGAVTFTYRHTVTQAEFEAQ
jgi:uncharacterized repeat protein (TIGR01451 family)